VLQYADDILILNKGDVASMHILKNILEDISHATGLSINFHKSTFLPLSVGNEKAMVNVHGCALSTFPQTYLGLPLSP